MSDFWIQVRSGTAFDLLEPRAEDVLATDIAAALSLLCRFTGHTRCHYSVAQHCVEVMRLVERLHPEHALAALLHDAAEAYIGDMSPPLKALLRHLGCGVLDLIEARVAAAIYKHFGLAPERVAAAREIVKRADMVMLVTEAQSYLGEGRGDRAWETLPAYAVPLPSSYRVPLLSSAEARIEFLAQLARLCPEGVKLNAPSHVE